MAEIKRALISVYDKTGVLSFAKELHALGIEIISTGGTAELLKKEGIPVVAVSSVTQFPEMLDGRVKTLHPNLHAGLLALRDNPEHRETLKRHHISPIDLLVVNLYPFWDALKTKTQEHEIIEMIDIGGPAMLRSAAKNFKFVGAVSDPADYAPIVQELKKNAKQLTEATLRRLAGKVFEQTSRYDSLIHGYFSNGKAGGNLLPAQLDLKFEKTQDLRYGENSHQRGALYRQVGIDKGIVAAKKLHGKEISFNNVLDLDAAFEMANAFKEPVCAIIKHTNPCGFATGRDARDAFKKAYACDPLSAFGSIIAFNSAVDEKTAKEILNSGFVECVIAVSFTKQALSLLTSKKNLRLLTSRSWSGAEALDFKKVSGGLLAQDRDERDATEKDLKCVTKLKPSKKEITDLLLAFKICRFVKSNAIVVAKAGATVGLGMGQTSRVDSCHTALRKAGKNAKGAVLASDGFFPKPDSILLAKKDGIRAIIQPGGSIQDEEIIKACDRARIAMVFTGIRHFRH